MRNLKIVPNSEGEKYFMELLEAVDVKREMVICRIGEIFNLPYNEYFLSDGLFRLIREHILEKRQQGI